MTTPAFIQLELGPLPIEREREREREITRECNYQATECSEASLFGKWTLLKNG